MKDCVKNSKAFFRNYDFRVTLLLFSAGIQMKQIFTLKLFDHLECKMDYKQHWSKQHVTS